MSTAIMVPIGAARVYLRPLFCGALTGSHPRSGLEFPDCSLAMLRTGISCAATSRPAASRSVRWEVARSGPRSYDRWGYKSQLLRIVVCTTRESVASDRLRPPSEDRGRPPFLSAGAVFGLAFLFGEGGDAESVKRLVACEIRSGSLALKACGRQDVQATPRVLHSRDCPTCPDELPVGP